jgi:Peptidase family S41
MRRTLKPPLVALWVCFALTARPACATDVPQDGSGFYQGVATSKEAGQIDLAANIRKEQNGYSGEIVTSVGKFSITKGDIRDGRLVLEFRSGDNVGTVNADVESESLRGSFTLGSDSGPLALKRISDAKAPDEAKPTLNLSPEEWREDIRFFAQELPARHANAFFHTPRAKFETALNALEAGLDRLEGDQIYVRLNRVANMIGDAHTYVDFPDDRASLPLQIGRFGDDYRVIAVLPGEERLLGAKIVAIDHVPIARVVETLKLMTPAAETDMLARARIQYFLRSGMVLHGSDITAQRDVALYTLSNNSNQQFNFEARAIPATEASSLQWSRPYKVAPLYLREPNTPFRFEYLESDHLIYCNFKAYDGLAAKAAAVLAAIQQHKPDKLVIDMRANEGGDYTVGLEELIKPLRTLPFINRKGHLFVLIGPETFSAAMANAAQFRFMTAAILVGETIGERPNSYQEPRQVLLPNSRLSVHVSTKHYEFAKGRENLIKPDQKISPTWDDYAAGRDPVLDWARKYDINRKQL